MTIGSLFSGIGGLELGLERAGLGPTIWQAETDPSLRKLLGRLTVYVIPRPAPDACEAFFRQPFDERSGNERPRDDDHDGQLDEDGPDDLNGDGLITMMRVEDPTGSYMPHPDDARVMIEADPAKGQQGRYRLFVEGYDNDKDEQQGEDPAGGVALNRNFTFRYPYFGQGAGPHQISEPETRAVADFAFSHPNIAAVLSFTPEDNLMKPWKPKSDEPTSGIITAVLSDDAAYLDHLAEQYAEIHGGEDPPESPKGEGSLSEWAYFHYGRWSLGCRGWWIPKVETEAETDDEKTSDDETSEEETSKEEASDDEASDDEASKEDKSKEQDGKADVNA
ncbi:hypothetical protein LCGC14_2982430, partial [marine sediment metagenome]